MVFLTPLFLIGLLAALIPVAIHLIRREKPPKVMFSTIRFLKKTSKKLVLFQHLQQIALLLLRAAVIVLLVLAFARPLFNQSVARLLDADPQSAVILLDLSMSMRWQDNFDQAKAEALAVVDRLSGGDELGLVAFSGAAEVVRELDIEGGQLRELIESFGQPGFGGTRYYPNLRLADQMLEDSRYENRAIYLISDFQEVGLQGADESWKLAPGVALYLIDVGSADSENLVLTDVRSPEQLEEYTPNIHPFNWRGWWEYGTGALGDVGCHLIDIPFRTLNLKYPKSAECSVGSVFTKMWNPDYHPEGCPPSSLITLNFSATEKSKSPIELTWTDGGIRPPHPDIIPANSDIGGEDSLNGVLMIGDKGIISTNINDSSPLMPKLYLYNGETDFGPEVEEMIEPEYGHQRKWVDACKAGFNSKEHQGLTSSFDYAGPMTETVLMGNLAIRSYMLRKEKNGGGFDFYARKKLLWDGENMKITNIEAANQFVTRKYREGWKV